jgi:hypothetical protein
MEVNPVEWFVWIYGKWFVGHPWRGFFVVLLPCLMVFSLLIGALWVRAVDKYNEEHPTPKTQAVATISELATASQSASMQAATQEAVQAEQLPSNTDGNTAKKYKRKADSSGAPPTYSVTNSQGSIINQNSPNYGQQNVEVYGDVPAPDRHLSPAASTILHNELVALAGHKFRLISTGIEAQQYAGEIQAVFIGSEWSDAGSISAGGGDGGGPLSIVTATETDMVKAVRVAFRKANIELPLNPYGYSGPVSMDRIRGVPDVVIRIQAQPNITVKPPL